MTAAAQAVENYEDEWGLNWYFLWRIYTSIPTCTHSHNSLAAAEALSLNISPHGTSALARKQELLLFCWNWEVLEIKMMVLGVEP